MVIDIPPRWKRLVGELLPELIEGVSFEFTSPVDHNYNCLAWALSCNSHVFENAKGAFWPWENVPDDTADEWAEVCKVHGFKPTNTTDFVAGYEKIAIMRDEDGDLHATRQDRDGKWKSKLGDLGPDIDHEGLSALRQAYGEVVRVLERQRPDWIESR
jgi:hypothetical protein